YLAPAAAKCLLFARPAVHGWMTMLGAGLARQHSQLFGAHALGIHVDQYPEARLLKLPQPEIDDLDALLLGRRNDQPCLLEMVHRLLLAAVHFILGEHAGPPINVSIFATGAAPGSPALPRV